MKLNHKWLTLALSGVLTLSLLAGCAGTQNPGASANRSGTGEDQSTQEPANSDALTIAEQGMFSAGGTVISSDGTFDTFTEAYNAADGSSTVVHLPDEGITGNSHFMFQELNNDVIADHIENWIQENVDQ